ncbi:Arsenical-resistance protein Acr3-like protein 2 [Paraphaeosphaeria sporulosa]
MDITTRSASQTRPHDENPSPLDDAEKGSDTAQVNHVVEDEKILPPLRGLSFLDRFLVIWIILAMAIGIVLGNTVDSVGPALQKGEFVGVSIPIGERPSASASWDPARGRRSQGFGRNALQRFESLHLLLNSRALWIQIGISFVLNWIVAPLFMVGLAWAFLPDRQDLREGLIFVGIARCIAMVLIWTDLAKGDGDYCAVLVAFNSILQIVLFAPFAVFYVQVVSHGQKTDVSYEKVAQSVGVFLGIPLGAAVLTRLLLRGLIGEDRYQRRFIRYIAPFSLIGLLYTIIVLFASQGAHVVRQITDVLRVCAPLLVYFLVIFSSTVWFCWKMGFGYKISCTQSFTAASNNFELAIAVVVAVYGAGSGQALASTVGPLIEVPVLVALVYVLKWLRARWQWV